MSRRAAIQPVVLLALLALLALACQTLTGPGPRPTQAPQPQPTPVALTDSPTDRIAYLGHDGNLYTIDRNGGAQSAITKDAGERNGQTITYSQPTWSPDGRRLAYVHTIQDGDGDLVEARVVSVAPGGSDAAQAFTSQSETPFYLYWSPDGENIAFLSSSPAAPDLSLWLAPVRAGESVASRVIDRGAPYYWAWAPDGHALLAHVGGDQRLNDDARLTRHTLTSQSDPANLPYRPTTFQAPAWSPDGRHVLFAAASDDGADALLLADEDGNQQQPLTTYEGAIAFAWSPRGDHVAYVTTEDPSPITLGPLYVIVAQSGAVQRRITQGPVLAFYWAPDGERLAYVALADGSNGGKDASPRQQGQLRFNLVVADIATNQRAIVAAFTPTQAYLRSVLPFFDQYIRSTTPWSPDSQRLVYSASDDAGLPGIYVVDVSTASGGAEPKRVADGVLAYWSFK
jgi:Tol biopolymer transport system component